MQEHLFIFAQITPKPEYFKAARDAIFQIIPATQQETGCQNFALHEGCDDGCLYLYEEWDDQHALDRHYAMDYTIEVFTAYEAWLAKPVKITKLHKLS